MSWPSWSRRDLLIFIMTLVAIGCLLPGVYLSMLTINTHGTVNSVLTDFGVDFFDTSNSVLNTVADLFKHGYYFVAVMIFLFSVIIPAIKSCLVFYLLFSQSIARKASVLKFMNVISKWSMNDVFIVAVFLAYLSTGSRSQNSQHEGSLFGFHIDIDVFVNMKANLEIGFYFFLAYCLISLVSIQIYKLPKTEAERPLFTN